MLSCNFLVLGLLIVRKTRDIDLPVDSNFAVAMRDQQQAEKREQKRIKDIVLNLDLQDDNDEPEGKDSFSYVLQPNLNFQRPLSSTSHNHNVLRRASSSSAISNRQEMTPRVKSSAAATSLLSFIRPDPLVQRSGNAKNVSPSSSASALRFASSSPLQRTMSSSKRAFSDPDQDIITHTSSHQGPLEKNPPNPYFQPRLDKAGKGRANQRGRQLQVSDLDW